MRVTEKDVLYVADLANLELTERERARLAKDLNSILGYIDRLNELDTTNVPPMSQISGCFGTSDSTEGKFAYAMRKDQLQPCLSNEAALQNAPDAHGGFFKVPKVIEK